MKRVDLSLMYKNETVQDYLNRAYGLSELEYTVHWVYKNNWGQPTFADIKSK